MTIHVQSLGKEFIHNKSELTVLSKVNVNVEDGEFISFVGPSGCGKSTLLNIIAGLEQQTSGQIYIDGQQINTPGSDRVMVFQESALFPWLNVFDNVMFGLKFKGLEKRKAEAEVNKYLKMVHLSRFAKAYPHELSGGMRQRVAIARALVMDPKYLLMDEPFGALDEQTKILLRAELQEIWSQTRKTILFVTHDIREAVQLSDRILVFGTRPGCIKKEFTVPYSRPRHEGDLNLIQLESDILAELREEIEKVLREEVDDDYNFSKDRVHWDPDRDMGSYI